MLNPALLKTTRPVLVSLASITFLACGEDEGAYQPRPAPTEKASLPPVPALPQKAIKEGEAYTVWGASYHQRSRVHNSSIAGKDIQLIGYIVKTNLEDAPACAVHETGKADPDGCSPPVPTFWIGESKDAPVSEAIKVMGWASNYAQIYDAVEAIKKHSKGRKKDEPMEALKDGFWGVDIPNPLPVKGAKVIVKGSYSTTFTKATTGAEADPIMGIMTYEELKYLEPPTEVAMLPGMKP